MSFKEKTFDDKQSVVINEVQNILTNKDLIKEISAFGLKNTQPSHEKSRICHILANHVTDFSINTYQFGSLINLWIDTHLQYFISSSSTPASDQPSSVLCSPSLITGARIEDFGLLYGKMVLFSIAGISISSALPFIWRLLSIWDTATTVVVHSENHQMSMFRSRKDIELFLSSLLVVVAPVIRSLGSTIVNELIQSAFVLQSAPELSSALTSPSFTQHSLSGNIAGSSTGVHFSKLPESFIRPYNDEVDSRNEYKSSQMESAVYNERQACFETLTRILREYNKHCQQGNSSADLYYFKDSLLPQCISLLSGLHDCNHPYLAKIFVDLLVFHCLQGDRAVRVKTVAPALSLKVTATKYSSLESRLSAGGEQVPSAAWPPVTSSAPVTITPSAVPSSGVAVNSAHTPFSYAQTTKNSSKADALSQRLSGGGAATSVQSSWGTGGTGKSLHAPLISIGFNSPDYVAPPPQQQQSSAISNKTHHGGGYNNRSNKNSNSSSSGNSGNNSSNSNSYQFSSNGSANLNGTNNGTNNYVPYKHYAGSANSPNRRGRTNNGSHGSPATPSSLRDEPDLLTKPSALFAGVLQFFFRFLVHTNNHRFNTSVSDAICGEIASLLKTDGTTGGAKKPSSRGGALHSVDHTSSSAESFAMLVAKLKVLGRFLGLLTFYPHWTLTADSTQSAPLLQQALHLGNKRAQLRSALPLLKELQMAFSEKSLSLTVPWVADYLGMMRFDSSALRCGTHRDCLVFLAAVQHSDMFLPGDSDLSSNRLFVLVEIQSLWTALAVDPSQFKTSDAASSIAKLQRIAGFDSETSRLDDNCQAFSPIFLHHVTPALEAMHLLLQEKNKEAKSASRATIAVAPVMPPTVHQLTVKPGKQKIKPTLQTVPEEEHTSITRSLTGSGGGIVSTTASVSNKLSVSSGTSMNFEPIAKTVSPPALTRSRTRSPKSTKKKSAEHNTGTLSLNSSVDSIASLGMFTPSKGRLTRSASTPEQSSPRKGKFGSSRYDSSGQHQSSPSISPVKMRSSSIADVGGSVDNDLDVRERMETYFWRQHERLQQLTDTALNHARDACQVRVKESTGLQLQDFIARIGSVRTEMSHLARGSDNLDLFSVKVRAAMRQSLALGVTEGQDLISKHYSEFLAVLPSFCRLYPIHERVVRMAISLATEQSNADQQDAVAFMRNYFELRFGQMCAAAIKQFGNENKESKEDDVTVFFAGESPPALQTLFSTATAELVKEHPWTGLGSNTAAKFGSRDTLPLFLPVAQLLSNSASEWMNDWLQDRHDTSAGFPPLAVRSESITAFRNDVSILFTTLLKLASDVTALCSDGGFCMVDPLVDAASMPLDLTIHKTLIMDMMLLVGRLSAVFVGVMEQLPPALRTVSAAHSGSTVVVTRELAGKVTMECLKFLTAVLPHVIFLDDLLHSAESALGTALCTHTRPSKFLSVMVRGGLISFDALVRTLPSATKVKAALFYKTCRLLTGMTSRAAAVGALGILKEVAEDFTGQSFTADIAEREAVAPTASSAWYLDDAVLKQLRGSLSEATLSFIATTAKNA